MSKLMVEVADERRVDAVDDVEENSLKTPAHIINTINPMEIAAIKIETISSWSNRTVLSAARTRLFQRHQAQIRGDDGVTAMSAPIAVAIPYHTVPITDSKKRN